MSLSKKLEDKAEEGIVYLISSFFKLLSKPLVFLYNKCFNAIKDYKNRKHIEKSFVQIEYCRMIKEICKKYSTNLIAFRLHNGIKSTGGYSYKNIKVFFSYITHNENKILKDFCYVSVPVHMFIDLIDACSKKEEIDLLTEEDVEISTMFKEYERLYCRTINDIYYILMTNDNKITETIYTNLDEMLLKLD